MDTKLAVESERELLNNEKASSSVRQEEQRTCTLLHVHLVSRHAYKLSRRGMGMFTLA